MFSKKVIVEIAGGFKRSGSSRNSTVRSIVRDETEANGKGRKDPGETQEKHPWLTLACQDEAFN